MEWKKLFESQQDSMTEAVLALKVVAHPARLKILCILSEGEHNVQSLEKKTGCAQATLSQHLARLKACEIVSVRREGTYSYYRVARREFLQLLEWIRATYC